jgi:cytochrome c peroxidase
VAVRQLLGLSLALVGLLACKAEDRTRDGAVTQDSEGEPGEAILPVPSPLPLDPAHTRRAALGAKLFADVLLSGDRSTSCATCHMLDHGGADGRAGSTGAYGRPTAFNTPTIFNVSLSYRYNWQGQFGTLDDQLDAALRDELSIQWPELLARLRASPAYVVAFAAYEDGITERTVRDAFTTYERTLTTPGSRFDRFRLGDANALTAEEKRGYADFKSYGCTSCHQGVNVGGNLRQPMGVMERYERGPDDQLVFRVPSLRNVALTAPYLHDGSAATLDDAIAIMATYQLGRSLTADRRRGIAAFLGTLTGEHEGRPLK